MTTAKNEFFIWLLLKNCYSVGALKLWLWGDLLGEGAVLASEAHFILSSKYLKPCLVDLF